MRRLRNGPAAPRAVPLAADARRRRPRERAQRVEGVVGDEALPDEIPERVDGLAGIAAAGRLVERREERRARATSAGASSDRLLARRDELGGVGGPGASSRGR